MAALSEQNFLLFLNTPQKKKLFRVFSYYAKRVKFRLPQPIVENFILEKLVLLPNRRSNCKQNQLTLLSFEWTVHLNSREQQRQWLFSWQFQL